MSERTPLDVAPGLTVNEVIPFTSTAELGTLLQEATSTGQSVVPLGGTSSLATGHPAVSDLAIDMTPNSGIISYAPADLTLSVRSGTTWSALLATLAEHGQTLPVDVPHPDRTTVGGLVATGFAGGRRYRHGSMRDLLIGCEYVRGDGLVARAGGMVVKNVSGFEIPRFLHGSWGSLAVLTSVNLKVVPKPRAEASILQPSESIEEAITDALELVRQGSPLEAIAIVLDDQSTTLALRASGRPRAVQEIARSLTREGVTGVTVLEDDDSATWWQTTTDQFSEPASEMLVAINAPVPTLGSVARDIQAEIPGIRSLVMPGYGSLRVKAQGLEEAAVANAVANVLAIAHRYECDWVVESAPMPVRETVAIWGNLDSGESTMRSIKNAFDPAGTLNRGRLFI